jgi:hypothetical protein
MGDDPHVQDAREAPVDGDRCIVCKTLRDEWDSAVEAIPVGGDETLCSNCAEDLRMYKRTSNALLFVNDAFGEDVAQVFYKHHKNAMAEARDMIGQDTPPNVWLSWSNARSRRRLELDKDTADNE